MCPVAGLMPSDASTCAISAWTLGESWRPLAHTTPQRDPAARSGSSPHRCKAHIKDEYSKYSRLIKAADIKIE